MMLSACTGKIKIHSHLTIDGRRRQGAAIIISPRPPDYSLSIGWLPAPTGTCLWTEMKTGPVQSTRPAWQPVFYYCQHVCLFGHSKYGWRRCYSGSLLQRSLIITRTVARRRSFNHTPTFPTSAAASKSRKAGRNLARLMLQPGSSRSWGNRSDEAAFYFFFFSHFICFLINDCMEWPSSLPPRFQVSFAVIIL